VFKSHAAALKGHMAAVERHTAAFQHDTAASRITPQRSVEVVLVARIDALAKRRQMESAAAAEQFKAGEASAAAELAAAREEHARRRQHSKRRLDNDHTAAFQSHTATAACRTYCTDIALGTLRAVRGVVLLQ
jgi:hypothetical protein